MTLGNAIFSDLGKVGREIKLGREMVQLDSPYTYFLFLIAIAYISPCMCPQSHKLHKGCMSYIPYICIFYLCLNKTAQMLLLIDYSLY